jgi:hypothetical protein
MTLLRFRPPTLGRGRHSKCSTYSINSKRDFAFDSAVAVAFAPRFLVTRSAYPLAWLLVLPCWQGLRVSDSGYNNRHTFKRRLDERCSTRVSSRFGEVLCLPLKSDCNGRCRFRARERRAASRARLASLSAHPPAHGFAVGSPIPRERANFVVT